MDEVVKLRCGGQLVVGGGVRVWGGFVHRFSNAWQLFLFYRLSLLKYLRDNTLPVEIRKLSREVVYTVERSSGCGFMDSSSGYACDFPVM